MATSAKVGQHLPHLRQLWPKFGQQQPIWDESRPSLGPGATARQCLGPPQEQTRTSAITTLVRTAGIPEVCPYLAAMANRVTSVNEASACTSPRCLDVAALLDLRHHRVGGALRVLQGRRGAPRKGPREERNGGPAATRRTNMCSFCATACAKSVLQSPTCLKTRHAGGGDGTVPTKGNETATARARQCARPPSFGNCQIVC